LVRIFSRLVLRNGRFFGLQQVNNQYTQLELKIVYTLFSRICFFYWWTLFSFSSFPVPSLEIFWSIAKTNISILQHLILFNRRAHSYFPLIASKKKIDIIPLPILKLYIHNLIA